MANEDYTNMKVWNTTIRKLRLIFGMTGEKMVSILERLVTAELERLQKEQQDGGANG